MIEIDGPLWFAAALLICGAHALYLRGWQYARRADLAWWQAYDAKAQRRHEDFMRAIDGGETVDVSWDIYKNERGQA